MILITGMMNEIPNWTNGTCGDEQVQARRIGSMTVGGPRAVGHLASVSSSVDISLLLQVMDQQPPVFTSPGYGETLSHGICQRMPCDPRLMCNSHVAPIVPCSFII